nr:MAG TPA: hypothetical protein [Caudoviricetes sp.]
MMKNLCKTIINGITGVYLCVPPLMEKGIKAKFYLFSIIRVTVNN